MRMRKIGVFGVVLLGGALATAPGYAKVEARTHEFEVYYGLYNPKPDAIEDTGTGGVRYGYNITQAFNIGGELGFISSNEDFKESGVEVEVDTTVTFLDLSFTWNIRPDGRWVTTLYAGPGYAWLSTDVDISSSSFSLEDDTFTADSLTFHGGFGGKIDLGSGDRVYLRFAGRLRYFDEREDDETDFESTIGLGWKFGG